MAEAQATSLDAIGSILKLLTGGPKTTSTRTTTGGSSTSQTQLGSDTVSQLLQRALESNQGLAEVMSGQRTSGMYNATSSSLLANDLVSRLATQAAVAGAPTVKTVEPQTVTETSKTVGAVPNSKGLALAALGKSASSYLGIDDLIKGKVKESFGVGAKGGAEQAPAPVSQALFTPATASAPDLSTQVNQAFQSDPSLFTPAVEAAASGNAGDLASLLVDQGVDLGYTAGADLASGFDWTDFGVGGESSDFLDASSIDWGGMDFFANGGRVAKKGEPQRYAMGGRVQQKVSGRITPDRTPAPIANVAAAVPKSIAPQIIGDNGIDPAMLGQGVAIGFGASEKGQGQVSESAYDTEYNFDTRDLSFQTDEVQAPMSMGTKGSLLMGLAKALLAPTPMGLAMLGANAISAATTGQTVSGNVMDWMKNTLGTTPALDQQMSELGFNADFSEPVVSDYTAADFGSGVDTTAPATPAAPDHTQLPSWAANAFGGYTPPADVIDYIWTIPEEQFDPAQNFGDFGTLFYNQDSNAANNLLQDPNAPVQGYTETNQYGGNPDWANSPFYLNMNADGGTIRKIVKPVDTNTIGIRGRAGKLPGHDLQGSDDVPALLTKGEYIIPVDVVDQLGEGFFDKLLAQYHTPV